jgi:hypothetical protein
MKIAITCHPIAGQQIAASNRTVYEIQDHSFKIRQKNFKPGKNLRSGLPYRHSKFNQINSTQIR